MHGLRLRSLAVGVLVATLVAVVLLPLCHLSSAHSEECPLCNPLAHGFEPVISLETLAIPLTPSSTTPSRRTPLPSGSPATQWAGRAPPTGFTV